LSLSNTDAMGPSRVSLDARNGRSDERKQNMENWLHGLVR
jgi:hypothetical protein